MTAPTDHCFDPGQKTIERIIIQRSYAHATEQLTSPDYFSQDQIKCINRELVRLLKDIAFDASKRKCEKKNNEKKKTKKNDRANVLC